MDHRPVYRDPRTGTLKFANFANPTTRYWGTLEWDSANDQWVLRRRTRNGTYSAVRSGRGTPDSASAGQLILDRVNAKRSSLQR